MNDTSKIDIHVINDGATIRFVPQNTFAAEQLKQRLQTAPWKWNGNTLAVDQNIAIGVRAFLEGQGLVLA